MFHALRMGRAVCGSNHHFPPAAAQHFLGQPPEGQLGLGIPNGDRAVRVHADERVVGRFDDHAAVLILLPEHFLAVLQGGDIPGDAGDTGNPAAPVKHRDFCGRHPTCGPLVFFELLDEIDLGPARSHNFRLLQAPAESVFRFEIVRIAFPDALRRVLRSESSRVRVIDSNEARLAILKINGVRNVFHQSAQQPALLVHLLHQFEVNRGGGDPGFEFGRFPRLGDIREDLSAIDCLGERAHVCVAGHDDASGSRNFSNTPQKLVPADSGHALIAQYYRYVMLPRQPQRLLGVGSRKHLVIVFEEMLKRRDDQ